MDVVNPTHIAPNKRNYRIPILSIIELKEKNLTNLEIAKLLDCSASNIYQRCQDIEFTNKYVTYRAKYFAHLQRKILQEISSTDLKKANLRDKVISAGILYDKERLESDLSTSNIAYADMILKRDRKVDELRAIEIEISQAAGSKD